ncbi:MAG: hypothetical protein ACRDQ7_00760 [Haloechinothrix sp.]
MNTDAPPTAAWPQLGQAERRVLEIQTKLHRWANDDPHRRLDDVFNLVADPGFLLMAWERVAGNKGARSAGVDGMTAVFVRGDWIGSRAAPVSVVDAGRLTGRVRWVVVAVV